MLFYAEQTSGFCTWTLIQSFMTMKQNMVIQLKMDVIWENYPTNILTIILSVKNYFLLVIIFLEYVCAAPKAYSLELKHKITGEIKYDTKCRGATIDCRNAGKMNHTAMRQRVFNFMEGKIDDEELILDYPNKFKIERRGEVFTVPQKKKFQCVINKGVLLANGEIVPFGWSDYNANKPANKKYYEENAEFWESSYSDVGVLNAFPPRKDQLDIYYRTRFHPTRNPNAPIVNLTRDGYERIE